MLIGVAIFLLVALFASRRVKGPVWAVSLAWLFCLAPIISGAVIYGYLVDKDGLFSLSLCMFIGAYLGGVAVYDAVLLPGRAPARPAPVAIDYRRAFDRVLPVARVCWCLAMVATAFSYIDFTLLGGAGLDDLAALRDSYANKASASAFAQIASILTWACLFCYIFALFFRTELSRLQFGMFLLPIVGYFLLSVFSAGRQAAFQIMLVTILLVIVTRLVRGRGAARVPMKRALLTRERLGVLAISAAMVGYMGYIAVARNDGAISDDKSEVLTAIFDFHFAPGVERVVQAMGSGLRGAIVEGVIYFSSSPALFDPFLNIHWPKLYLGAMSFPFFFHQVEAFTGLSPTAGLLAKVDAINANGQLGSGWATSMSSYLIDFGTVGTVVFLFIMGVYSGYAWRRALAFDSFYTVVIGLLVLINAVYMPLVPAVSDTNLLFLWLFCLIMHHRPYRYLLPVKRTVVAAE